MELTIKSKRAQDQGWGYAIGLAVLAVSVFVLIVFIYKQISFSSDLSEFAACYTSITGSRFSSEETIAKCPIENYKVYSDGVKEIKDGKAKEADIVKSFSANDNKVNELFAKLMGNCLQMGGGVNSGAFSRTWFTSSTICLECSNVQFDEGITKTSFNGLREYLEQNNVPGKDKKYTEFFTKEEAHKEDWINYGVQKELLPGKYDNLIEKNKVYTIFFIGIKEGTTTALVNARIIGREDSYFVYAATPENFNKLCDRKVN